METKTYFCYEYPEIDKIISEEYGTEFEFVADEEGDNYTCKRYNGMKKKELDKYDKNKLNKWILTNGKENYMFRILLQDMINRDILPEGNYLIEIYW